MKDKRIEIPFDVVKNKGIKLFSRPNPQNFRYRIYRLGREQKYQNEIEISTPPKGMKFFLLHEGGIKKIIMVR